MSDVKLCKNCRHCMRDRIWWWFCLFLPMAPVFAWMARSEQWHSARCRRAVISYGSDGHRFTGESYNEARNYQYCSEERQERYGADNCGPTGKYFEAAR